MSKKLPVISGKEAVKAFAKAGWHLDRTSGSHAILRKEGSAMTLSYQLFNHSWAMNSAWVAGIGEI
jgi:hypothetical protein